MKKKQLLFIATLIFISAAANSQITKGNWMVGGSGSFQSQRTDNPGSSISQGSISITPNAGYFVINKLVIGGNMLWNYNYTSGSGFDSHNTQTGIGPFIRYYFLKEDKRINLFGHTEYQYFINKATNVNSNSNSVSLSAGAVFFLNSSVGLELAAKYQLARYTGNSSSKFKAFFLTIGFQIYLESEKNYYKHH